MPIRVRRHPLRTRRGLTVRREHVRSAPMVLVAPRNPDFPDEDFESRVIPAGYPRVFEYDPSKRKTMGMIEAGETDPHRVTPTNPYVSLYWDGSKIRLDWYTDQLEGPAMDRELAPLIRESLQGTGVTVNEPEGSEDDFDPNWHETIYPDTVEGAQEASRRLSFLLRRSVRVKTSRGEG